MISKEYWGKQSKTRYLQILRKKYKNPFWWKRRFLPYVFGTLYYETLRGNKGIYVTEEDWDTLIILDACRYDTMAEVLGYQPDSRISRGSHTAGFLQENFVGRKFKDTVIIAANPLVNVWCKDCFHKLIPVWKDGWNDELGTVLAETMVEFALNAERKYPDKKLIAWFMQPHIPFIGDMSLTLEYQKQREATESTAKEPPDESKYIKTLNPWIEADEGKLDINILWQAYKKNLEYALPHALALAEKLQGKTVITADHGNAFRYILFPFIKIVSHPSRIYIEELVKVPWIVIDKKERKTVKPSSESETERIELRLQRLKNLKGI